MKERALYKALIPIADGVIEGIKVSVLPSQPRALSVFLTYVL